MMAKEQRLIDANVPIRDLTAMKSMYDAISLDGMIKALKEAPTAEAVEMPDKEMLRAVKLLLNQYEHSKNSDYVHSPVAHAFHHTWKQLDGRREGE